MSNYDHAKLPYFKIFFWREKLNSFLVSETRLRIFRGAFWGGVTTVATRGFSVVASFLIARILGKEGYGEYGILLSTASVFGGFAGLGIGTTVIKYVAELKSKDKARLGQIIALSTVIICISALIYSVVLVILAPYLAINTIKAPHLVNLLRISAVTVSLGLINGAQQASLTGCESFRQLSFVNIFQTITQSFFVLIGAYYCGIRGAIIGLAFASILAVCWTRWIVSKEWSRLGIVLQWTHILQEWKVIFQFSVPAFMTNLLSGFVLWFGNVLLANQPGGYEQLGVLGVANQWNLVVQTFPSLICSAILPIMSEKIGKSDFKSCISLHRKLTIAITSVVVPVVVGLYLISPFVMKAYGPTFVGGELALCLSVTTAGIGSILGPSGQLVGAAGKMWIGFLMTVGLGLLITTLSFLTVQWGANGIALARLVGWIIHMIWVFLYVNYLGKMKKMDETEKALS
jgi:O-antigen/teichoic acid export membrane protein